MKPVTPRDRKPDVILTGPPPIEDLPAIRVHGGGFLSEWDLSLDERKAILDGARVHLWMLSKTHPPVMLEVEGVNYLGPGGGAE